MSQTHDPSSRLVEHLSLTSTPYVDPLNRVAWDRLDRRAFWIPEAGISLFGCAEFMTLPEDQRRMVSRQEFLHLLAAQQRFEGVFMERVSRMLQRSAEPITQATYHLHMLREHSGHALSTLELMRKSGVQRARGFRTSVLSKAIGRHSAFDSLEFWVVIYIGEELFNRAFRWLRKNHQDQCPVVGEMVRINLVDAARHLSHAHDVLETILGDTARWKLRVMRPLIQRIYTENVRAIYYPHASVYESAGLYPGEYWAKIARLNQHRARFVQQNFASTLRPFKKRGLRIV